MAFCDVWLYSDHQGWVNGWPRITCPLHSRHKYLTDSWLIIIHDLSWIGCNVHSWYQCLIKFWAMVISVPVLTLPTVVEFISGHSLLWSLHLWLPEPIMIGSLYRSYDKLLILFAYWPRQVGILDTNIWQNIDPVSSMPWSDFATCFKVDIRSLYAAQ